MTRPWSWILVLAVLLSFATLVPTVSLAAAQAGADTTVAADTSSADPLAQAFAGYSPENRAYQRSRVVFELVSPLLAVAVGLLLLFTGVAQRFRDLAEARARGRWARLFVFFTLYSLVTFAILLPSEWCQGFLIEHKYGLSTQTLGAWLSDQAKGLASEIVVIAVLPLLWLAWRTVERHPRRWWLRFAFAVLPFALIMVVLQPLVFEPLFNKFTPLRDVSLRSSILDLAARADIPARKVLEVDMSKRTKKLNAYVSGFGASQRIVLWDTTLERLSRDEILFVMGHEMGHYKLGHIWRMLLVLSVFGFGALYLTHRLVEAFLARFGARLGLRGVADMACIPLLMAMLGLVGFLGQPVTNAMTRVIEHESDVYAIELTRDNASGATAFLKLAEDNRADPDPPTWVEWVLYSHPPLADRIRFAMEYKPWEKGEPNRLYRGR
jgi:Zn-dependent protease with chaperone function